jgi:PKD repeat protein
MSTSPRILAPAILSALSLFVLTGSAEAQNLRVTPVPWVATDVTIPHQAYNGHATIFKAIARGGNGTYQYRWDFDGNGVYDQALQSTTNRYNLSASFTYPNQTTTTTFQAKLEVTSNGQTVVGTYPVRVFADVPSNPAVATDRQLQVMSSVATDNALWYLHNRMSRSGNEEDSLTGAQITGNIGEQSTASAAGFLWTLSLNGHFAAWPAAYIGEMPNAAENTQRFRDDPYAEDAARLVNYLVGMGHVVNVAAADESNLTGFYPEVTREPIFGTDDGLGYYVGNSAVDETVYYHGHVLSALAVSRLQGFVSQVGDSTRILGRRYEYVIQQMTDAMVWHQSEAGVVGSFFYTPNSASDDLSTTLWGITGLWHADEFGAAYGIIVPNLAKARLAQFVQSNRNNCPAGGTGGSYATSTDNNCDFGISAAHTLVLGWVFANQFNSADTRLAFPGYNSITRGNLRSWYDSSQTFITNTFSSVVAGSSGWNQGFVVNGDFGRTDGQGCHYCMLHWQDAARSVEPEIVKFGANNWYRQFARYFINNQAGDGGWNWSISLGANSDSSGGAGLRAAWAVLVLSPDAIPPLAIGTSNVTTAAEGTPIDFNGSTSDPGTGNPAYSWAFGNGQTQAGQNVAYAFPDNGSFTVALTSQSVGGTSVDTFPVTITNVAPTANGGADKVVNEGASTAFDVTVTDPGTADTFTYAWAWQDATPGSAVKSPSHTFADNGVRNVVVNVTDDDGGAGSDTIQVTVNNVAPTITSTPGVAPAAVEGVQFAYDTTFTDPGTADTFACSKPIAPAGSTMSLVGGACQFRWTPNFAQAIGASTPVRVCVTDDDGGQTCQDFTIAVTFLDTDHDDLPDSWETSNFGNTASTDQFGDPDHDGMNNLQEFNNVTNPNTYDGPSAPTAQAPICGSEIATQQATLVAKNATDPQGQALHYEFELYRDPAMTVLVISQDNIAQGAGQTTSYQVPVSLLENTHYYWRVRASDPFTHGPYSAPVCGFLVNTGNEAPNAPRINAPALGGQAPSLTPVLKIDNAVDPDEDVLTYTYEVYRDQVLSQLVASASGRPAGAGTSQWQVDVALSEDTTYYWRARAVDPDNVPGDWSTIGRFFVTTVNSAPEPPVIVAPQNGTLVTTLRPELITLNANDADQDILSYDWQLATDDSFGTIVARGDDVPTGGVVSTRFHLGQDLLEDHRYCWRVRADDGRATSAYVSACFLASAVNAAPSVPVLDTPLDFATSVDVTPTYYWVPATDAEGAPITYDVQILDAGGRVVQQLNAVSGTSTQLPVPLQFETSYRWRARAVDSSGLASAFSPSNGFTTAFRDQDHDGLSDTWETQNFGSIAVQDQFGDPDADGRTNRQELTAGSDPNRYDGPGLATTAAPGCDTTVGTLPVALVAGNAVSPVGEPLQYGFELYSDASMTLPIGRADAVAQGAGATTSWLVAGNLVENHRYFWRVRARDSFTAGPYSASCSFVVSSENDVPGTPTVVAPADGARLSTLTPTLTVGNTTDPDTDPLAYSFEVYADAALTQLVAAKPGIPADVRGQTSWTLGADLVEDQRYYWRARATDPAAASGPWTAVASFSVSAVNAAPEAPGLVAPQDESIARSLRPELVALAASDVDHDELTYDWALARDASFTDVVAGANGVAAPGAVSVRFTVPADLDEDGRYCWRVRATDGQLASAYSTACFLVSAVNAAPSVPVQNAPAAGATDVTVTPSYAWAASTDPEGDAITYDVQVQDQAGAVVMTAARLAGTTTQFADALDHEATYRWRVRAIDRSGLASAYSPLRAFTTGLLDADGDGLPDRWELDRFGSTASSPAGDPDGDGRSNLVELTGGTDPTSYDGPSAVVALMPSCDSVASDRRVKLVVQNAVSPAASPLRYQFELYADAGMAIPVAARADLPEGGGTTEWTVPFDLDENRAYWWRVRAADDYTPGAYSPACRFVVDSVAEAPGAPRVNTPAIGNQVAVHRPELTVDNAVDADGDPLTYTFAVYADAAMTIPVASVSAVAAGAGSTSWQVDAELGEDRVYYWRSRATDDDGLTGPWTATGSFFVSADNAPPSAPAILLPIPGSVASTLRPDLAIVNGEDADRDVLVYDWQLATDQTFATILDEGLDVPTQSQVSTHFVLAADLTEDARYCWRARADDGVATSAYAVACFTVSADNAPPSVPVLNNPSSNSTVPSLQPVFSWAPSSDVEGQAITYDVQVLDSAGLIVTDAAGVTGTATLMPAPLTAETSYKWRVRAVDAEGGASAFSATSNFATGFLDADGDGLPDSWEAASFTSIAAQDQFGDPDGDGRPNLHEYLNGTSPTTYDGPGAPSPASPACGSELADLNVQLSVTNAAGPSSLRYGFELYRDQGLSIPVLAQTGIVQGAETTSWLVPQALVENTHYYWRARARDAFTSGSYSPACGFFVNSVNEAPDAPRLNTPAVGGQVDLLRPVLTVDNAGDPDEDALTYTFQVYAEPSLTTLVASHSGVVPGVTATSWRVDANLTEDRTYYWRVQATDPDRLAGGWSATGSFFVSTTNTPPEVPTISAPQDGAMVATLRPELIILDAADVDHDVLAYDWQLASDATFANVLATGDDQRQRVFALTSDLTEDHHYCWRVRSDDGRATSAYAVACFTVSTSNEAPSVPTLMHPADGAMVTTSTPAFSWLASTDPEGEPVTYDVEVLDPDDVVVTSIAGVTGNVTATADALSEGVRYHWHARAVDRSGGASDWSAAQAFQVSQPIGEPTVEVGGGCQIGGASSGHATGGTFLLGLGLMGLLRRRRRQ